MNATRSLRAASIALVAAMTMSAAIAQTWPAKPVRLVAVFPPGGSVDQVSRVLAQQLTTQLGQTFIVENKGGASGSIGTAEVARSAPDGYTYAVVFDTHAVNPSLIPNLAFDTAKDLASVTLIGTSAMAIVAHASQPYNDFRDVVAAAKKSKGAVAYGSIGSGSLGHLAMAQIGNQLGVEFTHVPYRGGGPLMNDAIAGQVPLAIGTVFLVTPHVRSGKVKPLAVTSGKRDEQLPDAQPVAAQGVPGFEALAWWGVFAPAGTPQPIVRRMHEELAKALKVPAVAERLTGQGMTIVGAGPAELDAFVGKEIARWAKVVKDNNIRSGD
jgi:tripartite-type tricarboxylate transporter receptor subunit TctC